MKERNRQNLIRIYKAKIDEKLADVERVKNLMLRLTGISYEEVKQAEKESESK